MEQSERTDLGQFMFTEVKLKYPHIRSWYSYLTSSTTVGNQTRLSVDYLHINYYNFVVDIFQEKSNGRNAHYKLTSTVMLWLQSKGDQSGIMNAGGNLCRQVSKKRNRGPVPVYSFHGILS
jgi:hypothetical protein